MGSTQAEESSRIRLVVPDHALPSARPASLHAHFRRPDAERVLRREHVQLARDAASCRASVRQLQIQALLHLPAPNVGEWRNTRAAYDSIRDAVLNRASRMSEFRQEARNKADLVRITPAMQVTRKGVETSDGRTLPLEVRPVPPTIGHHYQSRLHYLLSPRADIIEEWGLFEKDCEYPLLYLGFAPTEGSQVEAALTSSPGGMQYTLARAVSIVNLPKNAFSYTLAKVSIYFSKQLRVPGIFTAVNPYLGFTSSSVLAAGFEPFAKRPVAYWYNEHGSYTTRRYRADDSRLTRRRMPPNIQFYRDFERQSARGSLSFNDLPMSDPRTDSGAVAIPELRERVESIAIAERARAARFWSDRTRHPDFIGTSVAGASGQCGVTSVHVARALMLRCPGIHISYCYGDLVSRDPGIGGIRRHCWLRIRSDAADDLIVDCTPDQPGGIWSREVLVMTEPELGALGLHYVARTVRTVDALVSDRVWPRYLTLAESIMKDSHVHPELV